MNAKPNDLATIKKNLLLIRKKMELTLGGFPEHQSFLDNMLKEIEKTLKDHFPFTLDEKKEMKLLGAYSVKELEMIDSELAELVSDLAYDLEMS